MASPTPCPECAQGKHQNCTEQVLLSDADVWESCSCSAADHHPHDEKEHP